MFNIFKEKSQREGAKKNEKGEFEFLRIDLNLPDLTGEI